MELEVIFFLDVFCFVALSADKDAIKASTLPFLLKTFNEWDIFVKRFLDSKNILDFPLAEESWYSWKNSNISSIPGLLENPIY